MELHPTLENRLPPGAEVFELKTADGIALRGMKAGSGERGTILLLNGRTDYLERYFETMRDLIDRGFCVASFDWRGQGGSQRLLKDRQRGHITNFKYYDEDLNTAMQQLVRAHCPGPYYALAHSTGGHVLLRNILTQTMFSKAVITAPLMELNYGPWPRWMAHVLSYVMVRAGLSWMFIPGMSREPLMSGEFLSANSLTSEPKRWERDAGTLRRHPELSVGGATYGWLNATMNSINSLKGADFPNGPKCPVLMVLAGRERIVDNTVAQRFARLVPGVSLVYIQDSLHEILMEREVIRQEFLAGLDNYLGADALAT
jgi:lysophospholipase